MTKKQLAERMHKKLLIKLTMSEITSTKKERPNRQGMKYNVKSKNNH